MNLGPLELGLILVIILLIFGVGKLPEVFRSLGEGVREFRDAAGEPDKEKTGKNKEASEADEESDDSSE